MNTAIGIIILLSNVALLWWSVSDLVQIWMNRKPTGVESELFTYEREASLVSEIGEGTGGHKYWNRCGVIHGLGFKAYADDFPAGTKITVTAKIELPTDKTAQQMAAGSPPAASANL